MLGHPKGLFMLFSTEMWERFSFYGMRAILVLYIIGKASSGGLGWSNTDALQLYGTYLGLAYMTPLLGGWIADRFIGQRAAVMLGGILMATGHFLIAFNDLTAFYTALGLIALGNGFFKPCVTSILGGLYSEEDTRRDSAYSIFYMGINVGALLGAFIAGWLQVQYGFDYGFTAAGFGMLMGLFIFWYASKTCLGDVGKRPPRKIAENIVKQPLTKLEKNRIAVIFIVTVIQILYVMAYEQGGGLLTIYADQSTDRIVGGWEVPTSWFIGLNPLFIILFAPVLSVLWGALGKRGKDFSFVTKFGLGFILTGIGFLLLVAVGPQLSAGKLTHPLVMVAFYAFYTLAELMLFPVFWSAVSRLAPARYISLLMAVALSSLGLGSKLAGTVGSYVDAWGSQQVFFVIMTTMFVFGGVCLVLNKKLIKMTQDPSGETALKDVAAQAKECNSCH